MIGKQLAHYRILSAIGHGGMGHVYLAIDTRLRRHVAIKLIARDLASDERELRFEREAQALAALDHPNIVTVYAVEEAEGQSFLVMEHVAGTTLADLDLPSPIPLSKFLELAIPLTDAVATAHEHGVTHRDIKPSNVMLDDDGQVKVLDFGLAKLRPSPIREKKVATTALTKEGRVLGTAPYMSPEQALGAPIDHRSDIFSLGILLYEIATGRHPFRGRPERVLMAILRDQPSSVTKLNPELPGRLDAILKRCLEKEPRDRYQSARELHRELADLRRTHFESTRVARTLRTVLPRRWVWRPVAGVASLAAVAIGVWAAVTVLTNRDSSVVADREGLRVAVSEFQNRSGDTELDWLASGIPDMVVTALAASPHLRVASPGTESVTAVTRAEARRRGARAIVVGSYFLVDGDLRIDARIHDTEDNDLMQAESVGGLGPEPSIELIDRLASRIRIHLELEASDEVSDPDPVLRVRTRSIDAYRSYVLGTSLLNRRHTESTVAELHQSTTLDRCFAHAFEKLAHAYRIIGEDELAIDAIEQSLKCSDRLGRVDRYRILRRKAQIQNDLDAEHEYLRQLVALEPQSGEWQGTLAWFLRTHRRSCTESVGRYREALRLEPFEQSHSWASLGEALLGCGRVGEALSSYRQYVATRPEEPDAYTDLGRALLLSGSHDAARSNLERALELKADFLPAIYQLARYYAALGRLDEAVAEFQGYISLAIGSDEREIGHCEIALHRLMHGDLTTADAHAAIALRLDPSNIMALWLKGRVEVARGELEDAKRRLRALAARFEERGGSLWRSEFLDNLRAHVAAADGDIDGAIRHHRLALEKTPTQQDYYRNELASAIAADNREDALEALADVLAFNPSYAPAHLALAQLHESLGHDEQARRSYGAVLAIWKNADPDLPGLVLARSRASLLTASGSASAPGGAR